MKLLVFAASHRKQSINRKLAAIAAQMAQEDGHSIDFPEYGDLDMPVYDDETAHSDALPEAARAFVARLEKASGVILSSPEYNWSFPGSLKNIIDWASIVHPNPFAGKAALLLSASPSLRGGAQGLVHLKLPLESLGMFVFPHIFTLGRAEEAFTAKGGFKDTKLNAELGQLVRQFLASTEALNGHLSRSGNK